MPADERARVVLPASMDTRLAARSSERLPTSTPMESKGQRPGVCSTINAAQRLTITLDGNEFDV
jgi:hypothetical protein